MTEENKKYVEESKSLIQKFLQESTRLEIGEIPLSFEKGQDFSYGVRLNIKLKVKTEVEKIDGKLEDSSGIDIYYNISDYESTIPKVCDIERNDKDIFEKAYDFISNSSYRNLFGTTRLHEYPKKFAFTSECYRCGGSGEVDCPSCGGSGYTRCDNCGGKGSILKEGYSRNSMTGQDQYYSYEETCPECRGSGTKHCYHCNGTGKVECPTCNGKGYFTEITTIVTFLYTLPSLVFFNKNIPNYIIDSLNKTGIDALGKCSIVKLNDIIKIRGERRIEVRFDLTTKYVTFKSKLNSENIIWIIYGNPPQIFDAGFIIEKILIEDLKNLKKSTSIINYLNPFFYSFNKKNLINFMKSESHQNLLKESISEKDISKIAESLNRSFSKEYIKSSLKALKRFHNIFFKWSLLKWSIFSGIFMYCLIILFKINDNIKIFSKMIKNRFYLTPILNETFNIKEFFFIFKGKFILFFLILFAFAYIRWHYLAFLSRKIKSEIYLEWLEKKVIIWYDFLILWGISIITTIILLYEFPVWIDKNKKIFGVVKTNEIVVHLKDFNQRVEEFLDVPSNHYKENKSKGKK